MAAPTANIRGLRNANISPRRARLCRCSRGRAIPIPTARVAAGNPTIRSTGRSAPAVRCSTRLTTTAAQPPVLSRRSAETAVSPTAKRTPTTTPAQRSGRRPPRSIRKSGAAAAARSRRRKPITGKTASAGTADMAVSTEILPTAPPRPPRPAPRAALNLVLRVLRQVFCRQKRPAGDHPG